MKDAAEQTVDTLDDLMIEIVSKMNKKWDAVILEIKAVTWQHQTSTFSSLKKSDQWEHVNSRCHWMEDENRRCLQKSVPENFNYQSQIDYARL